MISGDFPLEKEICQVFYNASMVTDHDKVQLFFVDDDGNDTKHELIPASHYTTDEITTGLASGFPSENDKRVVCKDVTRILQEAKILVYELWMELQCFPNTDSPPIKWHWRSFKASISAKKTAPPKPTQQELFHPKVHRVLHDVPNVYRIIL